MLILNRKKGQKVLVGEDVLIEVVEVVGGKVKLGFTAPDDVRIDRLEVREAIERDGGRR